MSIYKSVNESVVNKIKVRKFVRDLFTNNRKDDHLGWFLIVFNNYIKNSTGKRGDISFIKFNYRPVPFFDNCFKYSEDKNNIIIGIVPKLIEVESIKCSQVIQINSKYKVNTDYKVVFNKIKNPDKVHNLFYISKEDESISMHHFVSKKTIDLKITLDEPFSKIYNAIKRPFMSELLPCLDIGYDSDVISDSPAPFVDVYSEALLEQLLTCKSGSVII